MQIHVQGEGSVYCMSESLSGSSAGPGGADTGLDVVSFLFPQDSHFLRASCHGIPLLHRWPF